MKRKALLAITECTPKAFETFSARGFLPFVIEDGNWSDYTIYNAFSLKALTEAAACTSLSNAAFLAACALDALAPMDPFGFTDANEMWVALIHYHWPDAPEGWDCREVVAGRWCDLDTQAKSLLAERAPGAAVTAMLTVSATKIANTLLREARDFGLPEGEIPAIPENLTGYPKWFVEAETARRNLLADWGK